MKKDDDKDITKPSRWLTLGANDLFLAATCGARKWIDVFRRASREFDTISLCLSANFRRHSGPMANSMFNRSLDGFTL